jgi:hypothetical protein
VINLEDKDYNLLLEKIENLTKIVNDLKESMKDRCSTCLNFKLLDQTVMTHIEAEKQSRDAFKQEIIREWDDFRESQKGDIGSLYKLLIGIVLLIIGGFITHLGMGG